MSSAQLTITVAGAVVVPVLGLIINVVLRATRQIVQSAASDALLLLIVFDATVLITLEQFRPLVRYGVFRDALAAIYVVLLFVGLLIWIVTVTFVEKRLVSSFQPATGTYAQGIPFGILVFAWSGALALVALHVLSFLLKP